MGYLVAVAVIMELSIKQFQYVGCLLCFALGGFMFTRSMAEDLKVELHSINEMAKDKKLRGNTYKQLSNSIWMHANAKKLSKHYPPH